MNAKIFLSQYRTALINISNIERTIGELESLALNTKINVDNERVQSSGNQDTIGDLAARICDMKQELNERRAEALEILRNIENTISEVRNDDYKQLLHLRYIGRMSWEEIAVTMHYSYRHITRLHGMALIEIESVL